MQNFDSQNSMSREQIQQQQRRQQQHHQHQHHHPPQHQNTSVVHAASSMDQQQIHADQDGHLQLHRHISGSDSGSDLGIENGNTKDGNSGNGEVQLDGNETNTLYIKNVHYSMSKLRLRELFEVYGHINACHIPVDKATNTAKGIAYISYETDLMARDAIRHMDGACIAGRIINVQWSKIPIDPVKANPNSLLMAQTNPNATLYVKNVHFDVTQDEIKGLFLKYGQVVSVTIPKDRASGRPRGVAFVAYDNEAQAHDAVKHMNGAFIAGRCISVQIAEHNPSATKNSLFVKNVHYDVSEFQLRREFERYGIVTACIIPRDKVTGKGKGFAYISYKANQQAELGLVNLNGYHFAGRTLSVQWSDIPTTPSQNENTPRKCLYIKNVDYSLKDYELIQHFLAFGTVTSCIVPKDKVSGKGKGFGYVIYESPQDAWQALKVMDGAYIAGRNISVQWSDIPAERMHDAGYAPIPSSSLLVRNLHFDLTIQQLQHEFEKFGPLLTIDYPINAQTQRGKGYAYLTYQTEEHASIAMNQMQYMLLAGRTISVQFVRIQDHNSIANGQSQLQHPHNNQHHSHYQHHHHHYQSQSQSQLLPRQPHHEPFDLSMHPNERLGTKRKVFPKDQSHHYVAMEPKRNRRYDMSVPAHAHGSMYGNHSYDR